MRVQFSPPPQDKKMMSLTGKILMTCDLARRYGIKDTDGKRVWRVFLPC